MPFFFCICFLGRRVTRLLLAVGCILFPLISCPNIALSAEPSETDYEETVARLNSKVESAQVRAKALSGQWLPLRDIAELQLARAYLTRDFADYQVAEKTLEKAINIAPPPSGPLLSAAQLDVTLHRLEEASAHLEQIATRKIVLASQKIATTQLKGDIALQRGDFEKAKTAYENCEQMQEGACAAGLADYYSQLGEYDKADSLLQALLQSEIPQDAQVKAWIMLQRAVILMRKEDYKEALNRLRAADEQFSGWWLIQEHIAEVQSLLGDCKNAVTLYKKVIAATESPQFYDAIAGCYSELGQNELAAEAYNAAEKKWERQLKEYPEAVAGHALDHYLEPPKTVVRSEKNLEKALSLAERNMQLRPNPEAKLMLGEVYLEMGRVQDSKKLLAEVVQSPYRSLDLYDQAAEVFASSGDTKAADEYREKAKALRSSFKS